MISWRRRCYHVKPVLADAGAVGAHCAPLSRSHGVPRVYDQRVVSGIIHVIGSGRRWRDAPAAYASHKTLYNRSVRWSRLSIFNRIFAGLVGQVGEPDRLMIDVAHLKAPATRPACFKMRAVPPGLGRFWSVHPLGYFVLTLALVHILCLGVFAGLATRAPVIEGHGVGTNCPTE
jgi:transposase